MIEFSATNFQAWPNFTIKVSGLTMILGPSNLGKSAIFRALRGVLRNEIPSAFIKDGSEQTILSLSVNDHKVIFKRPVKGSAEYKIGNERYTKLAGGLPPQIERLNFGEVEMGGFKIDPIFASQFDSPFLISTNTKPTELNAILGGFASTEKLEYGKKQAALQIAQKNSDARTLASEIGEAEERKNILEQLQGKIEKIAESLQPLDIETQKLQAVFEQLEYALGQRRVLQPLQDLLKQIKLPDLTECEHLNGATAAARSAMESFSLVRFYKRVAEVTGQVQNEWPPVVTLFRKFTALQNIQEAKNNKVKARKVVERLNRIIETIEIITGHTVELQSGIKALKESCQTFIASKNVQDKLASNELSYDSALEAVSKLTKEITETEQALQLVQCPKCGTEFNPNHACKI